MLNICFWPGLKKVDYSSYEQRISGYEIILERTEQAFEKIGEITSLPNYPLFQAPLEKIKGTLEAADLVIAQNFVAVCNLLIYKFLIEFSKPAFYVLYNNPCDIFSLKILTLLLFAFRNNDYFITGTETTGKLYELINRKINLYPSLIAGIEEPKKNKFAKKTGFLTYVGRIAPDKDILSIFKLLEKLKEKQFDFEFHLVGQAEPDYASFLKIFLENSSIKKEVVWEGVVDPEKLSQILSQTDIFLSFSVNKGEILGLAPIEAMSYGAILLISAWNGYREIVPDAKFLVPVIKIDEPNAHNNVYCIKIEDALEKITKILSLTSEKKAKLRRACQGKADEFKSTVLAEKFMDFYKRLSKASEKPLFNLEQIKLAETKDYLSPEIFNQIIPKELYKYKIKEVLFNSKLMQKYLSHPVSRKRQKFLEDFLLKSFYT